MSSNPSIEFVSNDRLIEALKFVFADSPPDELKLRLAQTVLEYDSNPSLFQGLLIATSENEIVGTLWGVPMPGRTAVTGVPVIRSQAHLVETIQRALFARLHDWLDQQNITLNQIVVEAKEASLWRKRLEQHGYELELPLDYFQLPVPADHQSENKPLDDSQLEFVDYEPKERQGLLEILEATFIDSQDCPQLDGVQEFSDQLDGYEATGDSGHDFWKRICVAGEDAGLLLLSRHDQRQMMELVYIGIAPPFRRRGIAKAALKIASQVAQSANCREVVIAVSVQNTAAYRLYEREGFQVIDSRVSFIRTRKQNTVSQS